MYPTLKHGEQLIISNLFYETQNGDIVVVQEQNGYFKGPIVKRIIAKGGQTIKFDFENWKVWVDGELLEEDYINYQPWFPMQSDGCPEELVVPEGYLFVIGDNRNGSTDSRNMAIVGFVSEDEVMGRVIFRLTGRFGKVS
jgi:signal peptidase I